MRHVVALVAAVLAGCGGQATVHRRQGLPHQARVLGGTAEAVLVADGAGQVQALPRSEVATVEHPGQTLILVGAGLLLAGAAQAMMDEDWGTDSRPGFLDAWTPEEKRLSLIGLWGSGAIALLQGFALWESSRWRASPARPLDPRPLLAARARPAYLRSGFIIGGLFARSPYALGPLAGYEWHLPRHALNLRSYLAVVGSEEVRSPSLALAAGAGVAYGGPLRLVADVIAETTRQHRLWLLGTQAGQRASEVVSLGIGAEWMSREGLWLRASFGIAYRVQIDPYIGESHFELLFQPVSFGVKI